MNALSTLVAIGALSVLIGAQDIVHYKFDSACGAEVVNYATGPLAAPNGRIEENTGAPWGTGKWGGGLAGGALAAGYNRVRTGWVNPNLVGSFTMAFFMRQANPPGTALCYMGGGAGSFRLFTNGVAGRGLYQRVVVASGGNGVNSTIANDMFLPTDVQTPAAAGWVHIALVIDSTAQTGIWYINGVPDTVVNGVGGALINETGEITFGTHTTNTGSVYDIDELVMSNRAFSAAEVLRMATAARAGTGAFTAGQTQCGSTVLGTVGGSPSLGSTTFGLRVTSPANGAFSILLGSNRCLLGGAIPLPFDLGSLVPFASGCWLLTDSDLGSFGGVISGGSVTAVLGIPTTPGLMGATAFAQCLVFDGATVQASNGLAVSIGS